MIGALGFEKLFLIALGISLLVLVFDIFILGKFIYRKVKKKSPVIKPKKKIFRYLNKYGLAVFNIILVPLVGYLFYTLFFTSPQIIKTYPEANSQWVDYTKPIEMDFDRPFSASKLTPNISPEIKGRWEYEKPFNFLPFTTKAKFYPDESVLPETDVLVYLAGITNGAETIGIWENLTEFTSAPIPNITKVTPADKSLDAPVGAPIEIELDNNDGEYVEWEITLDPAAAFQLERNFDKKVLIKPTERLAQGKEYKLTIKRTPVSFDYDTKEIVEKKETETLSETTFTVVKAPSVSTFEPTGNAVKADSVIKVVFDREMDEEAVESHFTVTPEIKGKSSWENGTTFTFTPNEPLPKATKYSVIFTKGFKNKLGGLVEQDITYEFETIGYVKATLSPGPGASRVRRASNIVVTFDQEVDHASAQSKFSISPSIAGAFSWNGNVMTYNPSEDLGWGTKYTATVASGVKSIYGLDSSTAFSASFTIETQTFVLNVPAYYQKDRFACNLIAVKIALGYRGINKSQGQIQSEIGTDPTPWQDGSPAIWGNPHSAYVGDVTGVNKGYGVYWEPAASMMSNYRKVETKRGWNVVDLAHTIEEGNPVILWWQNGWTTPTWFSWQTPGGTHIDGLSGMHSEVAIGFNGSSDNPTSFIVQDPWRGRRTLSLSTFKGLWSYFNNTGVVVY